MKNVTLKKMSFTFFKGFKDYEIDFSDRTNISGANGQGKTTIFDGFIWVLFGKDSQNRAEFDLKTVDANNVEIPRVPHEVTVVLDVNGEEITLTRCLKEVWRRSKNSNGAEVFQGHETERLYNGVPCSVNEWQEKIEAIIKEDIFRYTTNPHYFPAQKADVQRALLFKMAGGVTDAEIIESNGEFRKLFAQIGNKTLVQFEEETKASLSRVRKELSDLPARIDERKRDEIVAEDWVSLEQQVAERTKELQEVEDAIADKAKAITAASEARAEIARKVSEVKRKRDERKQTLERRAESVYYDQKYKKQGIENNLTMAERAKDKYVRLIDEANTAIAGLNKERDTLLSEYRNISVEQITFNDADFTCPTCGRMYESDDVEAKKEEMIERFNADKVRRLEANKNKGVTIKKQIEKHESDKEEYEKCKSEKETLIADLTAQIDAMNIVEPDYDLVVFADPEYQSLSAQVQELESELESAPTVIADADLQAKKRTLSGELDSLKVRLNKREQIQKNADRIRELEKQNSNLGEEEVRLKGILYSIKEFSKARSHAISDRVNSLFKYVRFKLFDTQVNGEVVEVCEATYKGVPYGGCSTGEKVIIGLDIIRAIQRHTGISAPIFIENAEGITDYPDNVLDDFKQVISLVAIKGQTLTVKQERR